MWSKGFFIGSFGSGGGICPPGGSNINIDGGNVTVNMTLDLYVNEGGEVFAGSEENNSILIYVSDNEIYTRKVV